MISKCELAVAVSRSQSEGNYWPAAEISVPTTWRVRVAEALAVRARAATFHRIGEATPRCRLEPHQCGTTRARGHSSWRLGGRRGGRDRHEQRVQEQRR